VELSFSDILIRPIITEKTTTRLGSERTYAFEVGIGTNKHQVARAVSDYYGVKVEDVRTVIVRGKHKRFGRHFGKRSNWKKAYVTLASGDSINFYEGTSA
jgi:large subunit ribosomal protein L23